jgi:hypothetical protein
MAIQIIGQDPLPVAQTAWYHKERATLSDVKAFVWRKLWAAQCSMDSLAQPQSTEFSLERLNQSLECLSETA